MAGAMGWPEQTRNTETRRGSRGKGRIRTRRTPRKKKKENGDPVHSRSFGWTCYPWCSKAFRKDAHSESRAAANLTTRIPREYLSRYVVLRRRCKTGIVRATTTEATPTRIICFLLLRKKKKERKKARDRAYYACDMGNWRRLTRRHSARRLQRAKTKDGRYSNFDPSINLRSQSCDCPFVSDNVNWKQRAT